MCVCVCQCGCVCMYIYTYIGFPGGKESACQCRRSKRHRFIFWAWQPTPVFLLEIPVDRGAWQATVHRFAQIHPWLKWFSMYTHTHTHTHTKCLFIGPRSRIWAQLDTIQPLPTAACKLQRLHRWETSLYTPLFRESPIMGVGSRMGIQ